MDVHVPQPRNQVLAIPVHYLRARRWLRPFAVSYFRNPVAGNNDRAVLNLFAIFRVGLTVGVVLGMILGMILGIMSSVYIIAFGGLVWAAGWIIQEFNRPNS
jgi:hypothetical protein